ncbi:MAG TPA: hypothetical protein PLL20_19430 [Phycisphaerae bacterium]|nr:hypothetical protein [Phycisphaerae bacterium]HRR86982.1 hypothetical protein [Phycisphaerae bacterium]
MEKQITPAEGKAPAPRIFYDAPAELSMADKRRIFKGMVVSELEAGFLRYSRREALLKYAAKLKIPEFEACLLIAEAQFHAGDIEPIEFQSAATLEAITQPESWSIPLRLAVALAIATVIDLILVHLLFG